MSRLLLTALPMLGALAWLHPYLAIPAILGISIGIASRLSDRMPYSALLVFPVAALSWIAFLVSWPQPVLAFASPFLLDPVLGLMVLILTGVAALQGVVYASARFTGARIVHALGYTLLAVALLTSIGYMHFGTGNGLLKGLHFVGILRTQGLAGNTSHYRYDAAAFIDFSEVPILRLRAVMTFPPATQVVIQRYLDLTYGEGQSKVFTALKRWGGGSRSSNMMRIWYQQDSLKILTSTRDLALRRRPLALRFGATRSIHISVPMYSVRDLITAPAGGSSVRISLPRGCLVESSPKVEARMIDKHESAVVPISYPRTYSALELGQEPGIVGLIVLRPDLCRPSLATLLRLLLSLPGMGVVLVGSAMLSWKLTPLRPVHRGWESLEPHSISLRRRVYERFFMVAVYVGVALVCVLYVAVLEYMAWLPLLALSVLVLATEAHLRKR